MFISLKPAKLIGTLLATAAIFMAGAFAGSIFSSLDDEMDRGAASWLALASVVANNNGELLDDKEIADMAFSSLFALSPVIGASFDALGTEQKNKVQAHARLLSSNQTTLAREISHSTPIPVVSEQAILCIANGDTARSKDIERCVFHAIQNPL